MGNSEKRKYELIRKIAAGGMAEIHLARHWGEDGFFRDVVVKRLFPHLANHPEVVRKLQYEARLLSELCHPNIPQVMHLGHEDGACYLVMEYVDGHTVADVWRAGSRSQNPMPLPVALGIVMQACEALHHAHERRDRGGRRLRIVHRDVTPQNLMLTRDGVVKLMDFGVARTAARPDTASGGIRGTLSYMAPEQIRAKKLDRRADVFSIGVILYELTTSMRLFRGSETEVMTTIVEKDVRPPSSQIPEYPRELERIVMNALSRDRRHRTRSAAEIAHALERFAMAHGLLVGPRTLAQHFNDCFPAERVHDEALGMVDPNSPEEVTGEHDILDIPGDDLELSAEEIDELVHTDDGHIPAPLFLQGLPMDHESDQHSVPKDDQDPTGDGANESMRPAPTVPPNPLAGFDVTSTERPVVLLEKKKSPSLGPPAPPDPYLDSLHQRLQTLDDDITDD